MKNFLMKSSLMKSFLVKTLSKGKPRKLKNNEFYDQLLHIQKARCVDLFYFHIRFFN